MPEELDEALGKELHSDPSNRSKSAVISAAVTDYLARRHPQVLKTRKPRLGPTVLRYLKGVKRAPSPTLRRAKLALPKWQRVEN